jgi:N-acyl-L-homoserine lactone synthetase
MVSALSSDYSIVLITTKEELKLVHSIRVEVFVDEQGFSMEDEMDEYDAFSALFMLYT